MHSHIYELISVNLNLKVDTFRLYSLILVFVTLTLMKLPLLLFGPTIIQGRELCSVDFTGEKKKPRSQLYEKWRTLVSIFSQISQSILDEIQLATTSWFVEAHAKFILH